MVQKVQKPPFTCKQAPNPLNYLTFWQGGFCTIGLQKPSETCKNPPQHYVAYTQNWRACPAASISSVQLCLLADRSLSLNST